jgi:type IV pilus assembly protein PilW
MHVYQKSRGHRRIAGVTLIELMVALAIGSFLMIGALTVYVQSRATFRANESISRLQENARYVFDVVGPDVRMANFWGLQTRSYAIEGRARPGDPISPLSPAGDCGPNWTIKLDSPVEGSNDFYGFGCAPYGTAAGTADTLVVRRAASEPALAPAANALYIQATRGDGSALFLGPAVPAGFPADTSRTHELVVNGYYVSRNSTLDTTGNPVPSLRRKFLQNGGAGASIADEEILPGVEDLQIQFGVDTDAEGAPDRGVVDRYVNPDDAILDPANAAFNPGAKVLTVRIWLRLRSEQKETGLPPDGGYAYADQNVAAFDDGFRRLVVSKTIYLRNARPPS